MNREIRERLNQLWRKLQKWERDGYEVSSLRSELEEFERQEGIVRRSKAPMVALIIILILVVGGGIAVVGINYHNKQIAIREKLRGEEETRRKAEEEARKLREKVRQDSIRLAERLKEEREAKKRVNARIPRYVPSGFTYIKTNSKGYREYKNHKDGSILIYIPAGEFIMGSNNGDSDEKPVHKVYLDGYFIGKSEVTNRQYKKFCDEAGHSYPPNLGFSGMNDYFKNYPDHPVVNVSWNDVIAYCGWAGLRLPTEAEWEKASRGTDGRKYPWGNSEPDAGGIYKASYNPGDNDADGYEYTAPVGSFPSGISPYGCYDMAGNVWEWCSDWYDKNYYRDSPENNPKGPASGSYRVHRGGSWFNFARFIRSAFRNWYTPVYRDDLLGFRVAR